VTAAFTLEGGGHSLLEKQDLPQRPSAAEP